MEPVFEELVVGQEVIKLVKPAMTRIQVIRYAGASGDFNPLHTDDEVARATGFDGAIPHGMLLMGIACQAVTDWIPKKSLKKIEVRFEGVARPGDLITVRGRVTDKQTKKNNGIVICALEVRDQNEDLKVSGNFEAELPCKRDKF